MSNHSGSYQLNEILDLLDREKVFDFWGKEKTRNLLKEMVNLARRKYDCNSGEILEGYDELVTSGSCGNSDIYFYQNLDWKYILRDFQVVNPFPQNLSIIPGESLETTQNSTPSQSILENPIRSNSVPIAIDPDLQPNNPEGSPDTGNYP